MFSCWRPVLLLTGVYLLATCEVVDKCFVVGDM